MKFTTSITKTENGHDVVRGQEWKELLTKKSFSEVAYLVLTGKTPSDGQARMFDAMLSAVIDHGPGVASALSARISASVKNPLHTSLAGGLLSLGERHGLAINGAMAFFYEHADDPDVGQTVAALKEKKIRLAGFGHKIFTEEDERVTTLFALAKETGMYSKYCAFAWSVRDALNKTSSKPLPINVDGAVAAILCDMGWDARFGNVIFLIGRVPGLLAHIMEEIEQDEGVRRLSEDEVEYIEKDTN